MSKKSLTVLFFTLVTVILSGCALTKTSNQSDVCTKMKREFVFRSSNPNREASWTTNAQKDAFKQKMRENNCL